MTDEEIEVAELPAVEAANAIGVSPRTVQFWLKKGELEGYQSITGRWFVTVGGLRAFIRGRGRQDGGRTEASLDKWLKANFPMKGSGETSTDVLCS